MLTVGSLFAGIGGFDLGLERAGMRTVWFCEQDAYCQRVLAKHWPGVPCYEDVRLLVAAGSAPSSMSVQVPQVDVLCGGFPCQDISLVGRGAGIDGARSGLWGEYARLIGELRPRYVLVENVPALLSRGGRRVVGDLAALGYDAEWDCLPASAFGALHRRDRFWLVAYPGGPRRREDARGAHGDEAADEGRATPDDHITGGDGQGNGAGPVADADSGGRGAPLGALLPRAGEPDAAWGGSQLADANGSPGSLTRATGEAVHGPVTVERPGRRRGGHRALANPEGERCAALGSEGTAEAGADALARSAGQLVGVEAWATEPDVGRVAYGVPARVDRLRSLGNALVPQIAQWIGERIVSYES